MRVFMRASNHQMIAHCQEREHLLLSGLKGAAVDMDVCVLAALLFGT